MEPEVVPQEEEEENLVPDDISIQDKCAVFSICFHPHRDVLAATLINGTVEIYQFSTDENHLLKILDIHNGSIRCCCFSTDGRFLFTGSADRAVAVVDMNELELIYYAADAHQAGVSAMYYSDGYLATGDDEGCIRVWDTREFSQLYEFDINGDFISGLLMKKSSRRLFATSGDCTFSAFDLHQNEEKSGLLVDPEQSKDEPTCLTFFKNEQKIAVGFDSGVIRIYDWGLYGAPTDTTKLERETQIKCMISLSENVLITAAEDGFIRAMHFYPHFLLSTVGNHDDLESIALSRDGNTIASCSSDDGLIKFWDVSYLRDPAFVLRAKKEWKGQEVKDEEETGEFQVTQLTEEQDIDQASELMESSSVSVGKKKKLSSMTEKGRKNAKKQKRSNWYSGLE